ncbi:MAG: DNA polymerase III subunit alpha [Breznakia sp.]
MQTHLHVRSCYTLLNSTLKIKDIVAHAKSQKLTSIALCDRNVMSGAMAFYLACTNAKIKPIFALEFTCIVDDKKVDLHAYACSDAGYQALLKLSTYLSVENSEIDLRKLLEIKHQWIMTTSGGSDDLQSLLLKDNIQGVKQLLKELNENFEEFYIAIAMNDSPLLKLKNDQLSQIAHALRIKTCAMSRIYYAAAQDEVAYKALCAIGQQKTMDDPMLSFSAKRYFRSVKEMIRLYAHNELDNAQKIADACNVEMKFKKAELPIFKNKYDVDSKTYLTNLCQMGLRKRLANKLKKPYVERLQYELRVITSMDFQDYFLIVYDFIRYAKTQNIYVGPGRGSAAGSLVAYCLGITHVDPIHYGLLFERFLNPERISMPDIDIDFPDDHRDEVLSYVKERYGEHHMAHITTFGTLAAKQVLRDVGRVLRVKRSDIDMLCKMVPNVLKIDLNTTYEQVPRFKQAIQSSKLFQQLFTIAQTLEGIPRHASTHAAGIVLTNKNIVEVCPLIAVEPDVLSTQFTMEYLEALGLIKIDFLGLRNLTIIDEISQQVKKQEPTFDIMNIPLDDQQVYKLLCDVDTAGIFQLESEGMKSLIRKIQPNHFEDIIAAIALFRPGPMENIPLYLKNRNAQGNIQYIHPDLIEITKSTYGIMIYQEQIMQATQIMANFSLGKADILRKAISKKIPEELKKLQTEFIKGSIKNGYREDIAQQVYARILKFAGYGFNRSHSVAYGLIAYQLAYLKTKYPLPFFASLLNSVIGDERKSSEYIFEARKRGIRVKKPNVNVSCNVYVIDDNSLVFPLIGIKNVGVAMSGQLLLEREQHGVYKNFFDFVARIGLLKITSKAIACLIDAGALDDFAETRATLHNGLEAAVRYASLVRVSNGAIEQLDFDIVSKPRLLAYADNAYERSSAEKAVLGLYLSEHPISRMRTLLNREVSCLIQLHSMKGYVCFFAGIEKVKQHRTKNGDLMAFVIVSDETSTYDIVCMPNIFKQSQQLLIRGNYIYVEGVIDERKSCLVKKIEAIDMKQLEMADKRV